MRTADYLVVGSGLTGATLARTLADSGREVLVLDRRAHLGGNVHDHTDAATGVRIHTYGPHYFRTDSERIWEHVIRFGKFWHYAPAVQTFVDGSHEYWPPHEGYLCRLAGKDWRPEFTGTPRNFEEACLAQMPRAIYDRCVRPYSEKQWGIPCTSLPASLAARFDVRTDGETRLKRSRYQGIPEDGYAAWMRRMLDGIPVELGVDYLRQRSEFAARKLLIFTGPIDEYFGFDLGRLGYRSQQRQHTHHAQEWVQACGQINNPQHENGPHVRTLEWKHMMPPAAWAGCRGTVTTTETPYSPMNPDAYEYPMPDADNGRLCKRYRQRAKALPGVCFAGRLGSFRYLDMDQTIGAALTLAQNILADRAAAAA